MKSKVNISNCFITVRKGTLKGVLNIKGNLPEGSVMNNHIQFSKKGDISQTDFLTDKDFMFEFKNNMTSVNLDGYAIFPKELLTKSQKRRLHNIYKRQPWWRRYLKGLKIKQATEV